MRRLLLVLFLFSLVSAWFYPNFYKRQQINLTYGGTAVSDVQVLLTIPYDADMQPDFSDLRFTYWDGVTESAVPFWIEDYTPSTSATVWVRLPNLASPGPSVLYVYYNNQTPVSSASDGKATFFLFDDFDSGFLNTSLWSPDPGFAPVISGGFLTSSKQVGAAANVGFDLSQGYITEARAKVDAPLLSYSGTFASPMSSPYTVGGNGGADATFLYMTQYSSSLLSHWVGNGCGASYNIDTGNLPAVALGTFYIFSIEFVPISPTQVNFYRDRTTLLESDVVPTWCKAPTYVRIGFFTQGLASSSSTPTTYDWVLVRKFYDRTLITTAFGAEENFSYFTVNILSPTSGSFVPSPFTVQINVTTSNLSNISLYLDGVLLNSWTNVGNGTLTYSVSATPGSHVVLVNGTNGVITGSDSVNVVVLASPPPPSGGGGGSVCIRCIAKAVWEYAERNLTFYPPFPEFNISPLESRLDRLLERIERLESQVAEGEQRQSALEERLSGETEALAQRVDNSTSAVREELERTRQEVLGLKSEVSALKERVNAIKIPSPPDYTLLFIFLIILLLLIFAWLFKIERKMRRRY